MNALPFHRLCFLLAGAAVPALYAYTPPVAGPVSFTQLTGNYRYSITDPVTGQVRSDTTPIISGTPQNYQVNVSPEGIVYYAAKSFDNVLGGERNYFGAAVYDPASGQWKHIDYAYLSAAVSAVINAGIVAHRVDDTDAGGYSWSRFIMATYEPDLQKWIGSELDLRRNGLSPDVYGPTSLINKDGIVAWSYATDAGLNKGYVHCAIYDPTSKQWKVRQEDTNAENVYSVSNGTVTCYPTYYGGATTLLGYNVAAGAWQYNITTKAISAFRISQTYGGNASSRARWITDMSVGSGRTIAWGDGVTTNKSGYHFYSSYGEWTVSEAVTGWAGDIATSSSTIYLNQAPTAAITGSTNLTIGTAGNWTFSTSDPDGNLSRWRVSLLPNTAKWTTISGSSRTDNMVYTFNSAGTYTFKLDVEDTSGAAASDQVTVTVAGHAPTASISGSTSLAVGVAGNWTFSATDADGNLARWRVSLLPNTAKWTTISGSSRTDRMNYTFNSAGTYTFKLDVEDTTGAAAASQVTVTVH